MATSTQTWEDIAAVGDVREMPDFVSTASIAMLSQYAHARTLNALALAFRGAVDATDLLEKVATEVADVQTAKGVFLDWWGKRIGVDRLIEVDGEYIRFDDEYYRFLVLYRSVCNISDTSAATINKLLSQLTEQNVFVVDYQDMSVNVIVVGSSISNVQTTILRAYGVLNRPAGVLTNFLVIYPDEKILGYQGSELHSFNQGVFNPGIEFGMVG